MFALVDAHAFYASAEEVFDPTIRNKPIVVLTNNDGCICAMSKAVKASGIQSFVPYHTVQKELSDIGAVIRSSNYELYADLSNRMFEVTSRFAQQHIYSVDEVFLRFSTTTHTSQFWYDIAADIRQTVWLETRIPVGVGLAPTPTLAKVASHAGKRLAGYSGLAILDNPVEQHDVLRQMSVGQIWGVGKRIAKKLNEMGIYHGLQLAQQSPRHIRSHFSVELERTVRELNGEVCFNWQTQKKSKLQINASRSFGQKVTCIDALKQSVATHAQRVGKKLREQNSLAAGITVFAHSNPLRDDYYTKTIYHQFVTPTDDSRELAAAAIRGIKKIYKEGVLFHKSGVGAIEVVDKSALQTDLFATAPRRKNIMPCMDAINAKFGNQAIMVASQGLDKSKWQMRRNHLSPQYTTKWSHIPVFSC